MKTAIEKLNEIRLLCEKVIEINPDSELAKAILEVCYKWENH